MACYKKRLKMSIATKATRELDWGLAREQDPLVKDCLSLLRFILKRICGL
jgi:hypothetical protein